VNKLIIVILGLFGIYIPEVYSQTPFECKGQYYLSLTRSGSKSSGLYEVKINPNGQTVFLDTISSSIGLVLNGMGYRITDNLIYGIDPNTAHLRKIGSDGVAYDLGLPKGIPTDRVYYAGDVSPDGKFLLLIGLGGATPQIVKVDLEHPELECTFVPLLNKNVGIVDIAFDPFTGILYGHDISSQRLVTLDPTTGAVNTNFVFQPQVDQLGALFFDSFGNLFGYGAYGDFSQDKFVSINKKTGEISLLAKGPISSGQDGCACPYRLELQKIVTPDTTYPCTEVVYSMVVSNGSGTTRSGINLIDTMPDVLKVKSVLYNPFGGEIAINANVISVRDMIVPVGIDTLKILVEVGNDALGSYSNQAVLSGLPPALGSFSLSDDPYTFVEKDSTVLMVLPFDLSFVNEGYSTCNGDSVLVDVSLHGITYEWSDGDTLPKKWLFSPGNYQLTARSLCASKMVDIALSSDLLSVNIIEDTLFVDLGEEIYLTATYMNIDDKVTLEWVSHNNPLLACLNCLSTNGLPLNDGFYVLFVTNALGCVDADTVYVRVKKNRSVYVPNIFSANKDGINDEFFLSGAEAVSSGIYFRIYDRWGNLVFEATNFMLNDSSSGWDGTFKGDFVEQGVYTWTASLTYIDGYQQQLSGDVTVIR